MCGSFRLPDSRGGRRLAARAIGPSEALFVVMFYTDCGVSLPRSRMLRTRPATIGDAALLSGMIREFADFEHELEMVTIGTEDLVADGFGQNSRFRALIAEWSGEPAGYALFFGYYSTWIGPGLFLEDLFVRPAFRGRGIGKALLAAVADVAVKEGCSGMRWEVLEWNKPAIELYKTLGADFRDGRLPVSLSGKALKQLAEKVR